VKRVHLIVSGLVHGVGFRYNARRKARLSGITGFARNLSDGTVEIEAQGTPEAIERFIHWTHHGPPDAKVDSVIVNDMNCIDNELLFEIK
jgi:acylphosphatase